jgi:hypothetical protein
MTVVDRWSPPKARVIDADADAVPTVEAPSVDRYARRRAIWLPLLRSTCAVLAGWAVSSVLGIIVMELSGIDANWEAGSILMLGITLGPLCMAASFEAIVGIERAGR